MEEIDLKELFDMFWKRKLLIIIVVILFAAMGVLYTMYLITPMYSSTTSLVLVQTTAGNADRYNVALQETTGSITQSDISLNSKLVDDYICIAKSKAVVNSVINELNLETNYDTFQKRLTVSTVSDTELISIKVIDEDPVKARTIAQKMSEIFIKKTNELYKAENMHVLDEPDVDYEPVNVNLIKNVVIFAFVGGILVAGYVLLVNMLDTSIKSDSDIEKATDLLVLATIIESTNKNLNLKSEDVFSYQDNIVDEDTNEEDSSSN